MSRPLQFYPILTFSMLALAACGETATQPETGGDPALAALSLAAAPNSWTLRAPPQFPEDFNRFDLGMAPNSAGQSIVYTFGGTLPERGGSISSIQAYNAATNTWSGRLSRVSVFNTNGVGKIGSKLYFSGGYSDPAETDWFTNAVWAYDYSQDRLIAKASLPIFSAEGVSGVIDGKLYVLPGACSGSNWPNVGYCAEEPTRRFYRYDPVTNTWVTRAQAPNFHRKGAAVVINGKFYVAGGIAGVEQPHTLVAALDVYDPTTNRWRTLAPMPTGGTAAGAGLHGKFYVVSGGKTYAYNPVTNQWKARAAAPSYGFGSVTRVTLDGRTYLFMATGNRSWLYTP